MKFDGPQIVQLKEAFDEMDQNKDGAISKDNLKQLLMRIRYNIEEKEIDKMIKAADDNGVGKI